MNYTFKGKLQGLLCIECLEPLSNVKIRLYRTRKEQDVTLLASVHAKETFAVLKKEEIENKKTFLLAETETDAHGNFQFTLQDKDKYKGEAFEIDVFCETVPRRKSFKTKYSPVQFTITTLQPKWCDSKNGLIAAWDYTLPYRYWCGVRARFGAMVVCGTVRVCKTNIPVQGVRVRAFDVDWLEDDPLGSAITDGIGRFRIDYAIEDFTQTPLSPWLNWEMFVGPDIYFKIETPSGTSLLVEPRSRGRHSDRENAGPCFCVSLCLEEVPDISTVHTYPLFTKIGQYRITSDFTPDGLTKAGDYAFTDTIPLRGILPDGGDSIAMEYRFLHGKYSAGTLGTLSEVNASMIPPTIIGQLEFWKNTPSGWRIDSEDYWVNNPGASHNVNVKPGGWIEIPRENNIGLPPVPGIGKFIPNSWLIKLNTKKLIEEYFDLTSSPVQYAGSIIPPAQKSGNRTFSIVFEARELGSATITDTNSLSKIIISNTLYKYNRHPSWAGSSPTHRAVCMLDIKEMSGSSAGCKTLKNDLNALFTAYNPHLGHVLVYFEGNSPLPASYTPTIVNGEALSGSAGHNFDISAMNPCTYILWLKIDLNLTQGWGRIPDYRIWDHIAFYKA